ncbi:MAG: prepilin-type N-terminal cleavage/methylation domain-containing protein [Phycisphaerae bacterium]|nr:prepilin-type N-terminal cleavage/methylation domain-containing protein [Phycisphaerae bacterium]
MHLQHHARRQRGFTLIEILIVVVILGILAAIVIPQFTNASQDAQVSAVKSQLQTVRSQIELYRIKNGSAALAALNGDPAGLFVLLTTEDDLNGGFQYLQSEPTLPNNFWGWEFNGVTCSVTYDAVGGPQLPNDSEGNPIDPSDW